MQSEKSVIGGAGTGGNGAAGSNGNTNNNLMGDTSLLQLRDAIDVLIGKLDEKIEASQHSQNPATTTNLNNSTNQTNKQLSRVG